MKNLISQTSVALLAVAMIAGWFCWELAATIFRTVILGQSAEEQMREMNLGDE